MAGPLSNSTYGGYGMPFNPPMTGTGGGDWLQSQLARMSEQDRTWAMIHHTTTQSAIDLLSKPFGAAGYSGLDPFQQRAVESGAMAAVNFGLFGPNVNPVDLMTGLSSVASGSGFRVGNAGQQPNIYGYGPIASGISQKLFSGVMDDFYQHGIYPNQQRTFGFGDTDMGVLANELTRRGAFQGMDLGDMENSSDGTMSFSKMDTVRQQITDYMSRAAQALSGLRDAFGGGTMQQLIAVAESLVGQDMVSAGPGYLQQRLGQTLNQAHAYGMDPQGWLLHNQQTSTMMAGLMAQQTGAPAHLMYSGASALSGYADNAGLQAYTDQNAMGRILNEQGRYAPRFGLEELTGRAAQEMSFRMAGELDVTEALAAINAPGVTGEQRAQTMGTIQRLLNARSPEEAESQRIALRGQIPDLVGMSGVEFRDLQGPGGLARMINPQDIMSIGESMFVGAAPGNYNQIANALNLTTSAGGFSDIFQAFDQAFSPTTQAKLIEYLERGDTSALNSLLSAHGGDLAAVGSSTAQMSQWLNSGGKTLGGHLANAAYQASGMSNMAGRQHAETKRERSAAEFDRILKMGEDADMNASRGSLLTSFLEGLTGQRGNFSVDEVMDTMATGGLSLADDKSGFAATDAEVSALIGSANTMQLRQLYGQLNVRPGDTAGLRAALNDPNNRSRVHSVLAGAGLVVDFETHGANRKLRYTTQEAYDNQLRGMTLTEGLRHHNILRGGSPDATVDASAYSDITDPKKIGEKLLADGQAIVDERMKGFGDGEGDDAAELAGFREDLEGSSNTLKRQAWQAAAARHPSFLQGLRKQQEGTAARIAEAGTAEEKASIKAEADEIQKIRDMLDPKSAGGSVTLNVDNSGQFLIEIARKVIDMLGS